MSASVAGSCPGSFLVRINRSRAGPRLWPGKTGSHCELGARDGSNPTLRGPVRRSYSGAMVVRQLPAATARSVPVSSTCMSFSASAKVEGDTSGPTAGAVPNAGGAPGGSSAGFCALPGRAAAAPSNPRDVRDRNCLRDFDIVSSELNCSRARHIRGGQHALLEAKKHTVDADGLTDEELRSLSRCPAEDPASRWSPVKVWLQRFPDGTAVETATGFGTLNSSQIAFSSGPQNYMALAHARNGRPDAGGGTHAEAPVWRNPLVAPGELVLHGVLRCGHGGRGTGGARPRAGRLPHAERRSLSQQLRRRELPPDAPVQLCG